MPVFGVPGAISSSTDTAINFSKAADSMSVQSFAGASGSWSIEFWFRPNDLTSDQYVLEQAANQPSVIFGYTSNTLELFGPSGCRSVSAIVISDTQWHAIVYSYTAGPSPSLAVYEDGVLVNGGACTMATAITGGTLLRIADASAGGANLNGQLDEIAIYYGGSLSAARQRAHYEAAVCRTPTPTATTTPSQTPTPTPIPPYLTGGNAVGIPGSVARMPISFAKNCLPIVSLTISIATNHCTGEIIQYCVGLLGTKYTWSNLEPLVVWSDGILPDGEIGACWFNIPADATFGCGAGVSGDAVDDQLNHYRTAGGGGFIVVVTATPTPTNTPTATATVTATPTPAPEVNLGTVVGRPGGIACLPASLLDGMGHAAGTSNDVGYDPSRFGVNSCQINPAIGTGTTPNKQLAEFSSSTTVERVGIFGFNTNPISDGLLFTCTVSIAASVPTGAYQLSNAPGASDLQGNDIPGVTGTAAQVVVTTCTGDCNGDGIVTIGEVIKCVNLLLGQPPCNLADARLSCPVADANIDGSVSIGEVVQCVNRFLAGCS